MSVSPALKEGRPPRALTSSGLDSSFASSHTKTYSPSIFPLSLYAEHKPERLTGTQ